MAEPPELEDIFSRFVDPVYRFLYSRVGNREDAEDLTSEVFLKATRQLDPGQAESSIASWLFTVARTVLADHWRRYYRSGPLLPFEETEVAVVPESGEGGENTERMHLLERVLTALPERSRRVLELRFLHGYSIQEVAQELDLTPNHVKVLQHRGLARAAEVAAQL